MKYYGILLFLVWTLEGIAQVKPDSSWTLNNLQEVNSKNNDYLPFWVDSLLLFTSDRKSAPEGQTLEHSEKVYFSSFRDQAWSKVKKDGYKFNSDNNTALVGVSQTCFYFYRSYWPNNGELFSSQRKQDPKKPYKARKIKKLTNINSESDEVSITIQGDTSYFVSNRNGNYDIFMQVGEQKAFALDSINSSYDELDVSLSKNGKCLFFSSNRPGGFGGYDIYQSIKTPYGFSSPKILGFPINTENDDRDFRYYNDTLMFLASDRTGGQGGLDIWWLKKPQILLKKDSIPEQDTLSQKDTIAIIDSTPHFEDSLLKNVVIPKIIVQDSLQKERDQLYKKLDELGLLPFRGEIQLGAYRFIRSTDEFNTKFDCLNKEDIRMDTRVIDGKTINKFIINRIYKDLDSALTKQLEIISLGCLPNESFIDMPFIGLLDKDNNRFAIFWKKDEFTNKQVFYILKNGKTIWKGKRF